MDYWKKCTILGYEVNAIGDIRSTKMWNGREIIPLKKCPDKAGYSTVHICNNGRHKHIKIHREVAIAFIENPDNKKQVNHINGVKCDNRVENLEWATASENQLHAIRIGLAKHIKRGHTLTHCKRGHEFTAENSKYWSNRRICRTCANMWHRIYREREKNVKVGNKTIL